MDDPNSSRDMFSEPPKEKASRLPWLIAGGVVLIIIGVILFVSLSQQATSSGGKGLAVAAPYASHLSISHIQLSQASTMVGGQPTYIDGTVVNHGNKTVTGVTVQAVFDNENNKPAQISTLQMQRIRTRVPYVDTEPLGTSPIGPGKSMDFRLILDHVPASWNQNPPTLRIIHVDTQ